jgi:hypothetical protein
MRLNRWRRIGVVLSVLWMLGGAAYERKSQVDTATSSAHLIYKMCLDIGGEKIAKCSEEFAKNYADFLKPNWIEVALSAFAPVILGWLLVIIIIWVYRWIKAGDT